MEDMVLSVKTLPEQLYRRIRSDKVRMHEENGVITLIPIDENKDYTSRLFGMFSDGRLSTEKYMAQKQLDKGLER